MARSETQKEIRRKLKQEWDSGNPHLCDCGCGLPVTTPTACHVCGHVKNDKSINQNRHKGPRQPITCGHPDRKHTAFGMCDMCYQRSKAIQRRTRPRLSTEEVIALVGECAHKNPRPRGKFVVCDQCYRAAYKRLPEIKVRENEHARERHKNNPEPKLRQAKEYTIRNREKYLRMARNSNLKKNYGITQEDYDNMLSDQGGVCAICNIPPFGIKQLDVDHDHSTGVVRGIVCHNCNIGIGNFQDDPVLLEKAAAYLRRHGKGRETFEAGAGI